MFHEHCNLIQFLKIYGLCNQGKETGDHCSLNQCMTPSLAAQRPSPGVEAPSCIAIQTHTSHHIWEVAGCMLLLPWRGSALLIDEPFDLTLFCLCLISYKSFPHPTDSPKSQQLKKHRKAYTKATR